MGERAIKRKTSASPQGTNQSLEVLFRKYHENVYLAAFRVTGSVQDAEDVLQSVFLRILKQTENRNLGANPASYLCRAAINASFDILRAGRRVQIVSLEDNDHQAGLSSTQPESETQSAEQRRNLRSALSNLNSRAAEMFALRYFEDFGNTEIAEMLGTSSSSVAVTLHRTRDRLQELLRESAGESL